MASEAELEALARTTGSAKDYGIAETGFVAKPIGRLLEEKLAAARVLFGDDVDLTAGSALRKLLEVMAMEEARTWEHLGRLYESTFVAHARGEALSMLGEEIGIPRPHHRATGDATLTLAQDLPTSTTSLVFARGTRLLTPGGHDYFLDQRAELTAQATVVSVPAKAFYPGPEQHLEAGATAEFNESDGRSSLARTISSEIGDDIVTVEFAEGTSGGELLWSDEAYRDLLLAYPRNLWTPDAVRVRVALVPGVRQVHIRDKYGGLDINQSIFGNFSFFERLFAEQRSLGSPYFITVLVAMDTGAIWSGPGQLYERVSEAIDEVRPIGIHPAIEMAQPVGVSFECSLTVEGVPIPAGSPSAVNSATETVALKQRIIERVRRYVQSLGIGEPVRYSEVFWSVMEEPGVVDCKSLHLRRYPPSTTSLDLSDAVSGAPQVLALDQDVQPGPSEIAVLVEDLAPIVVS